MQNKTVFLVCFTAAMAGLVFGIDIGVIAQAKDFIKQDLQVDDTVISWVVGSMMGGATAGAMVSGILTRRLGRKVSLLLSGICFVLGSLFCAISTCGAMLIVSRIIVGLSVGIASFTAPLYLSEVAPKSIRGTMITMYQLLITAGILASFLINTLIRNLTFTGAEGQNPADFLITDVSISWRTMLFVTLIPSSIFLLGVLFLPRSPRWLISVGRHQEALTVLKKIRNSDEEADSEAREISDTVAAGNTSGGGFSMFRTNSNFRRTVYLGITLQLLQQLCGINIIMYFGPELIKAAAFIAIALIDKWGRKKILLVGYTIMAVAMMCVAVFMSLGYSMAAIACVLLFIVAFAFSAGPVVWVLCAEIQPLRGRDFGITCSTCANWFSNMAIAATFLPLTTLLGNSGTMAVYAVCSVAAIFLIWAFVPETKGVSLERLEKNLMAGVKLRDMGRND